MNAKKLFEELQTKIQQICTEFLTDFPESKVPKSPVPKEEQPIRTEVDECTIDKYTDILNEKEDQIELLQNKYSKLKSHLTQCDQIPIPSLVEPEDLLPETANKGFQFPPILASHKKGLKLRSYLLDRLKVSVKELKTLTPDEDKEEKEQVIGGGWTYIALKNRKSYLTGTQKKHLKLVENNETVYQEKLPVEFAFLLDMIYIPAMDCYFLHYHHKLYRKDIDDQPPYMYMNIFCGVRFGACFRYSETHQRLIINKNEKIISAVNLEAKELEIEVKKSVGDSIIDFRIFGEKDERAIAFTKDGYIVLYSFDFRQKTGEVVSHSQIELFGGRAEWPKSISVCSKGEYPLIEIGEWYKPYLCSRMLVYKIGGKTLTKMVTVD